MKNNLLLLALFALAGSLSGLGAETARALAPAATSPAGAEARKPNIIYLLADDLGYGDLGSYGQQLICTPRLDQLAAEGMRFTQHYAGAPSCHPSRAVLFTGRHTGHAFIRGNSKIPLRAEDYTLSQMFKAAGYATGGIGKWALGDFDTTGALAYVRSVRGARRPIAKELSELLYDIESFAHLANYYASKIRGATHLHEFRTTGVPSEQAAAISALESGLAHWKAYAASATANYRPQFLSKTRTIDWVRLTDDARRDIDIARAATAK